MKETGAKPRTKTAKKAGKRRLWIWAVVAVLLVIGSLGARNKESTPEPTPEPTVEVVRSDPAVMPRPSAEPTPAPVRTYVLNTDSHVFHYSWCSSAESISTKNRQDFEGTRDDVISQGYEPCSRCNP